MDNDQEFDELLLNLTWEDNVEDCQDPSGFLQFVGADEPDDGTVHEKTPIDASVGTSDNVGTTNLNEEVPNSELDSDDELLSDVLVTGDTFDSSATQSKSHLRIRRLALLLLTISLFFGIYIIFAAHHVLSLTNKDESIRQSFRDFAKAFEKPNGTNTSSASDKTSAIMNKVNGQVLVSLFDLFTILSVISNNINIIGRLHGALPFANLLLLFDYTQQLTPIRLAIECFVVMAITNILQTLKPFHSIPLFPCTCDPDEYIKIILCSVLPCFCRCCCKCCSDDETRPNNTGPHGRMEMFKLGTSVALLISFAFSISTFHSLYAQVDEKTTVVYVTAIIMNSIVSLYAFVATFAESYRSLSSHLYLSIPCGAILIILALRLSHSAAWLLLPLATSVFATFILTCLIRLCYDFTDFTPCVFCKQVLVFWQVFMFIPAPTYLVVTYMNYTGAEQDTVPMFVCCGVTLVLVVLQCLLLYGTLAEKHRLLNYVVNVLCFWVIVSVATGMLLFSIYPDTSVFISPCPSLPVIAAMPVIVYKYYIIELQLLCGVMTEDEIWIVYRRVHKFFKVIKIIHTISDVCPTESQVVTTEPQLATTEPQLA